MAALVSERFASTGKFKVQLMVIFSTLYSMSVVIFLMKQKLGFSGLHISISLNLEKTEMHYSINNLKINRHEKDLQNRLG